MAGNSSSFQLCSEMPPSLQPSTVPGVQQPMGGYDAAYSTVPADVAFWLLASSCLQNLKYCTCMWMHVTGPLGLISTLGTDLVPHPDADTCHWHHKARVPPPSCNRPSLLHPSCSTVGRSTRCMQCGTLQPRKCLAHSSPRPGSYDLQITQVATRSADGALTADRVPEAESGQYRL